MRTRVGLPSISMLLVNRMSIATRVANFMRGEAAKR